MNWSNSYSFFSFPASRSSLTTVNNAKKCTKLYRNQADNKLWVNNSHVHHTLHSFPPLQNLHMLAAQFLPLKTSVVCRRSWIPHQSNIDDLPTNINHCLSHKWSKINAFNKILINSASIYGPRTAITFFWWSTKQACVNA